MSNNHRGEASIRLDKTRTLRYDFNALAEFEEKAGLPITEAVRSFQNEEGDPRVSFKTIRLLLWAGLLHEEPDLTVRKAGNLFESADGDAFNDKMASVFASIMTAITDKFGDTEAKKKITEAMAEAG